MGTVQYSLAAFAVLAALFSATRYVFTTKVLPATPYSTLVAPDVFHRLGYFTVADVTAPTYTFLVRTGQDYVLVDAGSPGREHTDDFMMAVKEAVGDGTLRLLLLTHGHIDHAGMVPELARAYPKLQVVMHALEEPYVAGGKGYAQAPSSELAYKFIFSAFAVMGDNVSASLPPNRVLTLTGTKGDLSSARGADSKQPKWRIPEGFMTFQLAHGHSPGQVVYTHTASGSLFSGDAVELFMAEDNGEPFLHVPPPFLCANYSQGVKSAGEVLALVAEAPFFTRMFPVHDIGGKGASKEQAMQLAEDLHGEGAADRWRQKFQ